MFRKVISARSVHKFRASRHSSNVAFIGLGNMGSRMARNLIKKGNKLKVFDIALKEPIDGAVVCRTAQETVEGSEIVLTMLPNGQCVKDAVLGKNGVLDVMGKSSLLVDCSTIEPKVAKELASASREAGVRFVDAPVSGGVTGAEAATLTFMTGGEVEDVRQVEPLLLQMGSRVVRCGGAGAGQAAKLCNNAILGATMVATAEGLNLGIKLGLDPEVLTNVINTSSGRSWSSGTYNPVPGVMQNVPSSKDYVGGFAVKLMAKDLALAADAAVSCDAPVPMTSLAHQLYRAIISNGLGDKDFAIIYKFLKGLN